MSLEMTSPPAKPLTCAPLEYEPITPALPRGRTAGVFMLLLAAALWSLSGVAVKLVHIHPIAFTFWRSLFAALAMLPLVLMGRGQGNWPPARWMIASIALYTAVVGLLITSMTGGTAANGILLQYTGPVFCAFFAWAFQGRHLSRSTLLAMTIAVVGIGIMVHGGWTSNWIPPTAGLLSGVAFGALILVLEKTDRAAGGANPFVLVLLNNVGTAVLTLPFAAMHGAFTEVHAGGVAILAVTGAIQLAIPYVLFQLAMRRVKPVDASLLILLEPVLNPIWVAMVTSERPDRATIIGGAAVLIAMVMEALKVQRDPSSAQSSLDDEPAKAPQSS